MGAERAHRRSIEAVSTDNLPAPFENFDWNANRVAKRASQGMAELLATYDTERGEV